MKSQKGITLISLTIYVIGMTIVIGILATLSTFFYTNTTDIKDIDPITEYTTFNNHFSEEVNIPDIKILESGDDYVVFDNGTQYTFVQENNGIYKNKVKICQNIELCKFEQGLNDNGNTTIKVTMKIKNDTMTNRQPIVYTLK